MAHYHHSPSAVVAQNVINIMSHCSENQNSLVIETFLGFLITKGIKKRGVNGFLSLLCGCVHTLLRHIYMQAPCKSEFCIRYTLKVLKLKGFNGLAMSLCKETLCACAHMHSRHLIRIHMLSPFSQCIVVVYTMAITVLFSKTYTLNPANKPALAL